MSDRWLSVEEIADHLGVSKDTSADVAEVIQKRLLAKNTTGVEQLAQIYAKQSNNFKTLLDRRLS